MNKTTLTVPELAKTLSISTSKAYELVHQENFPSFKIGKKWIVSAKGLAEWIDRQSEVEACGA